MLVFKKASDKDYQKTAELINSTNTVKKKYTAADIKKLNCHYIAKKQDKTVGCIGIIPRGDNLSEIVHVRVSPSYRRRGIGAYLVENAAKTSLSPLLICYINNNNIPSINLFIKLGFKKIIKYKNGQQSKMLACLYKK